MLFAKYSKVPDSQTCPWFAVNSIIFPKSIVISCPTSALTVHLTNVFACASLLVGNLNPLFSK